MSRTAEAKKTLPVRIPENLYWELKVYAAKKRASMSQVINQALEKQLKEEKEPEEVVKR